jgi:acyl-CoA thioester hydrolase
MSADAAPFVHRLRVRYNECDPQGVVFNANYFTYFDVALTELWREGFGSYDALTEMGYDLVVAEASARFLGAARFDDELEIAMVVARLGGSSMTTEIMVSRGGEVLVEGRMVHVFVDAESMRKTAMPDGVRERLERFGPDERSPRHP